MHLTFILSSLQLSGGVRVVIQYSNRLAQRGHRITLVAPGGIVDADVAAMIDPAIRIVQPTSHLTQGENPIHLVQLAWLMARITPRSDVIISTHTPTTAVSFMACKCMRKGKAAWFYQDYPEMFDGRPIERFLQRNAMRWHDLALTVSAACAQNLQPAKPNRVVIVGEGLDLDRYHAIPNTSKADIGDADKKVVLFLGDSRPRKGMQDFLAAAKEVFASQPDLVLWMVSKEETRAATEVPSKYFIRPTDAELARLYSACDVFVSASWYEGFGLPPLEAMACGAPVVTTDSRGVREYAIDSENCLMVPIRNPSRMAGAILTLLSNPTLAMQFRKNGPLVAQRFNWETATDRFEVALMGLLQD